MLCRNYINFVEMSTCVEVAVSRVEVEYADLSALASTASDSAESIAGLSFDVVEIVRSGMRGCASIIEVRSAQEILEQASRELDAIVSDFSQALTNAEEGYQTADHLSSIDFQDLEAIVAGV